jgi:glycosyltransferase involved in cell wall biosynthesis
MRTSILIIAHNEEAHIRECIESILNQSQKADEVVLIAHNCTDSTVNIVQEYQTIQLYELQTEKK